MNIPAVIREKAPQMDEKTLEKYLQKVWDLMKAMKPGDDYVIEKLCSPATRELFTECIKYYMRSHDWQDGLTFSRGFASVYKVDITFTSGKNAKHQPERSVFNNTVSEK